MTDQAMYFGFIVNSATNHTNTVIFWDNQSIVSHYAAFYPFWGWGHAQCHTIPVLCKHCSTAVSYYRTLSWLQSVWQVVLFFVFLIIPNKSTSQVLGSDLFLVWDFQRKALTTQLSDFSPWWVPLGQIKLTCLHKLHLNIRFRQTFRICDDFFLLFTCFACSILIDWQEKVGNIRESNFSQALQTTRMLFAELWV